jgi:hypothetical protein
MKILNKIKFNQLKTKKICFVKNVEKKIKMMQGFA